MERNFVDGYVEWQANPEITGVNRLPQHATFMPYASFEEGIKGSLEPGKLADVVILDQDLLTYPVEQVQDVAVRYTLVDGKVVYTRD